MSIHAATPAARFWKPGDQVLIRFRRRGPVSYVTPVTVVRDGPEHTLLYLRPGTPVKRRVMPDGSPVPRDLPYAEAARVPHKIGDGAWLHNHVLTIVRADDSYSVGLFWNEADWAFRGWYVNLQDPVRRVQTRPGQCPRCRPPGTTTDRTDQYVRRVAQLAEPQDCRWVRAGTRPGRCGQRRDSSHTDFE